MNDQQVDHLQSVRDALKFAEDIWSRLDTLRHEMSAADGLTKLGVIRLDTKLDVAATTLGEAIALLTTALAGKDAGKHLLTEAAVQQLDETLHGKF